tara:strand:- start:226 stop:453 length:228 start_codon:yes stop_codon:yes gene_type:complete
MIATNISVFINNNNAKHIDINKNKCKYKNKNRNRNKKDGNITSYINNTDFNNTIEIDYNNTSTFINYLINMNNNS